MNCPICDVEIMDESRKRLENHMHLAHPSTDAVYLSPDVAFRQAAQDLAAARVRYAQEFARFRMRMQSDGQAHQAATEATKSEITVLEAELKIAERRMR